MTRQRMTYIEVLDESPMTPFLWLLLIGVSLAQIFDGIDLQSTAYALPVIIRELKITPAQAGVIPAATNFGLLAGALVFAVLSDRLGRKGVFQAVIGFYAIGSLLSALAPTYQLLLPARVITGFGLGAEFPVAFALLAEYAPTRQRHRFIPLGPLTNSLGYWLAGLLAVWIIPHFGWRAMYWLGVTPALIILYIRRYIPESVRYLLARGEVEEAGRIARHMADRAGFAEVELVPPEPVQGAKQTPAGLLRTTLPTLIALSLLYFCFYIQSTGFQSWLPTIFVQQGFTLVRSFTFALIVGIAGMVAMVFAGWVQERIPRKYALVTQSTIGACFFIGAGLAFQFHMAIGIVVAAFFLTQLFVVGINAILFTMGSELFPTPVRSMGMGIVTGVGRSGAILGPLILGFYLTFGTQISQIIYLFSIPLVVASLVAVFLVRVDSRQKTLEMIEQASFSGPEFALGTPGAAASAG